MNHGVVKQLDLEDLLPLPTGIGPSSCHDVILSWWQAQLSNNGSKPYLFNSVSWSLLVESYHSYINIDIYSCYYAYKYVSLGRVVHTKLLKIFNITPSYVESLGGVLSFIYYYCYLLVYIFLVYNYLLFVMTL